MLLCRSWLPNWQPSLNVRVLMGRAFSCQWQREAFQPTISGPALVEVLQIEGVYEILVGR